MFSQFFDSNNPKANHLFSKNSPNSQNPLQSNLKKPSLSPNSSRVNISQNDISSKLKENKRKCTTPDNNMKNITKNSIDKVLALYSQKNDSISSKNSEKINVIPNYFTNSPMNTKNKSSENPQKYLNNNTMSNSPINSKNFMYGIVPKPKSPMNKKNENPSTPTIGTKKETTSPMNKSQENIAKPEEENKSLRKVQTEKDLHDEANVLSYKLVYYSKSNNVDKCFGILSKKKEFLTMMNINASDELGWTALHYTVLNGNYSLVTLLIYKGADIDLATKDKLTPLMIASKKGFTDIADSLIQAGADVNSQDKFLNTPLHFACLEGQRAIVEILLNRPSVNIAMQNSDRKPAFELSKNQDILLLFRNYFAKRKKVLNENKKIVIHNINNEKNEKNEGNFAKKKPEIVTKNSKNSTNSNPEINKIPKTSKNNSIENKASKHSSTSSQNKEITNETNKLQKKLSIEKANKGSYDYNTDSTKNSMNKNSLEKNSDEKSPKIINENINIEPIVEKVGPTQFHVHGLLGRGSFGEVYLVEHKPSSEIYAMKALCKNKIMKRNVLTVINHPFIIKLNFAFQTSEKLFLILDFAPGGDLGEHLQKDKKFPEERTRIYIAEILLALEELHSKDIIFRDLKPENIVLDAEGHAMLTDFGLSKEGVLDPSEGAKSFCGSVAYLAPEMLKRCGHGKAVDWYLLGVVMYEMLVGIPPYYANDRAPLKFPSYISSDAKSLLKALLQRNPAKRLGSGKGDGEEIKIHSFFKDLNWKEVYNRKLKPQTPNHKIKINPKYGNEVFSSDFNEDEEKKYISGWSFAFTNI